jgi:hypothetical protein
MAFAHAVIEGSMPGFVLVDDAAAPTCAFVCNLTGFWLALGAPDPDFTRAAVPGLVARCPAKTATGLWAPTRAWESALSPYLLKKNWRTEFHFDVASLPPSPAPAPPGLSLVPIDAAVAAGFGAGLDPWVIEIWGGPEEFAKRSFGFALVDDGRPVSFCAACAIQQRGNPREVEVEIGTDPAYRERRLGNIVGRAFVAECRRRHFLPAWTCGADNVPSERLAARLGFTPARRIAGFALHSGMREVQGAWI